MSLQEFRKLLRENRDIILTLQGQRVKARNVDQVVYYDSHNACDRCEERIATDWIVRGSGLYFVVTHVEECVDLYPREVEVVGFNSYEDIKPYLKEKEPQMFNKLYPSEVVKEEESDSY
jgi:hypothetical protein